MRGVFVCLMAGLVLSCGHTHNLSAQAEEIVLATDRPQPKPPEESAKCAVLPPGFRLDIVASEPLVRSPSAMCFDERGRLFVCEIHGYNLDGHLDIVELNKTGELDREVRRVRHATPESQAEAHKETYGTVKLLRDTDGDGRMDQADVWADRLPPCYGVIAARGGVIVICAPNILFLADRDDDGQPEVHETMFTGFQREYIERGMSNPRWGPDNWIYVAAGGGGGTITGPGLSDPVVIGHTDFRFRADGSAIEPVTGRETMFGLGMSDFGDRFHTIITYVGPLAYRYLARNPYIQSPAGEVGIVPSRQLFPISQPDPWRKVRGQDPEWVKFYGAAETQPNGQFTSSSGQMIYRDNVWPAEYHGNYFVCDPANNLIHRSLLIQEFGEYTAKRPPENEASEFLASTDQWFRPINLSLGPDGSMYIVDMYREIIEDFSAIPRFLQQQYIGSLIAGENHGRIWKLSRWPDLRTPDPMRLHQRNSTELVRLLSHSNPCWRETAQRLLIERADVTLHAGLVDLVKNGPTAQSRMHALYTLDGMSLLESSDVLAGLSDQHDGVRKHALELSERWLDTQPNVLHRVVAMIDDPHPRVRVQAALTLGESRKPEAVEALAKLAAQRGTDRWMAPAIASSIAPSTDQFLQHLLAAKTLTPDAMALLGPVGETLGGQRDAAAMGRSLKRLADFSGDKPADVQLAFLTGLARGLERGERRALQSDAIVAALEQLLRSPSTDVVESAVRVAGLLDLKDSPAMQAAWTTAIRTALDDDQPLASRLAAVSLVSFAPWIQLSSIGELLAARQPTELQLAVVKAFSRAEDDEVRVALLSPWSALAPKVQEAIVDACFARKDRLPWLLDAIADEQIPPTMLSALRREQLTEHGNEALRQRARELLSRRTTDERAVVLQQYQTALTLPRDPRRGKAVYLKTCAKCHKLGEDGLEVGPDLLAVRTRPDESLLLDILDPSGALARGYTTYAVNTTSGRTHTGLLTAEAATNITLRNAGEQTPRQTKPTVVEDIILRKNIDEMKALSKSLMPEGLEKELKPQDVADLLGFLRQSLGPVVPASVVLFDDEPEFVTALHEGSATPSLIQDDKHSGNVALMLTAGQRHSSRIKNWSFPIVEHPALKKSADNDPASKSPAQYRYLRFVWKSSGAKGVLLELAADGAWPPANQPVRRYYSGENSSGWAAREISADVPRDWTVVTVDLWKDFGEFTLTGIAPTALGGAALFDRIELLPAIP